MPARDLDPTPVFRATLARSWRLFRSFRVEQTDPDRFYGDLARDSVAQLLSYTGPEGLRGAQVLDVGGGPGYFATAFADAGATYRPLDADLGELTGRGAVVPGTVLGSGLALPFRDGSFEVTYSSNVLEHVPDPWKMLEEMVRVTRPGGLVFCSYTVWFGPWGGHETAPWHFLGGHRAARRYARRHGHPPKNVFGTSLFAVTTGAGVRWARRQRLATVIDVVPRYLPRWAHWIVRVPVLREFATWNLAIVLRAP